MNSFLAKRFVACFLHVLYYSAESNSPQTIEVFVNGPVTLLFTGSCEGAVEWKHRQMIEPQHFLDSTLVAHFDQGTGGLTPGERFKDRVKRGDRDLDLSITTVEFNDNGWYECYCNSEQRPQDVELVVFDSIKKAAHVGENVTLTFHALTSKHTPDIYWEKDGETVLNVTAGKFVFGHGFKDRASVSLDRSQHGDLSITITALRPSDQGVYQVFITSLSQPMARKRGHPDSFNLTFSPKVEEKQSEEAGTCTSYEVVVAVLVVTICCLVIFFYGKESEWFQWICSRFQSCYSPEVGSIVTIPEEHQESPADPNDEGLPLLVVMPEKGVNDPPVHVEQDREHKSEMEADKSGTGPRVYFSSDLAPVIRAPEGPRSAPGQAPNATG